MVSRQAKGMKFHYFLLDKPCFAPRCSFSKEGVKVSSGLGVFLMLGFLLPILTGLTLQMNFEDRYPHLSAGERSMLSHVSAELIRQPHLAREILNNSSNFQLRQAVEESIQRDILRTDADQPKPHAWYLDWALKAHELDGDSYEDLVRSFNRSTDRDKISEGIDAIQLLLLESSSRFRNSYERYMQRMEQKAYIVYEIEASYTPQGIQVDSFLENEELAESFVLEERWLKLAQARLSLPIDDPSRESVRALEGVLRYAVVDPDQTWVESLESLRELFLQVEPSDMDLGFERLFPNLEKPKTRVEALALCLWAMSERKLQLMDSFVVETYALRSRGPVGEELVRVYGAREELSMEEKDFILKSLFSLYELEAYAASLARD